MRLFKLLAAMVLMGLALPALAGEDLKSLFKQSGGGDEFLNPDQAFQLTGDMGGADSATLIWKIADKYYLYRDRIKITSKTPGVTVGTPAFPAGQKKHDEYFGDMEVYHNELTVPVPITRAAGVAGSAQLEVTYQGCAEAGLCYNPQTKNISLTLPGGGTSATTNTTSPSSAAPVVAEQDRLANILKTGSILTVIAIFFAAGVGLSLTPCVLPMIPILSGIIVGQGENATRARSFSLAFTYVQGMALTYAAAGAIFVLATNQAPQAFFQQPWILVCMGILFIALAFAMFGAYTLQLPSALQTRLTGVSNEQKAGTYVGTFIMGALSALVVTACVAPAVIAALSVISQTRMIGRGAIALYAAGMGMGVPLLIVGASAGDLLPKAGAWMDTVKHLFGVLFIGLAIYIVGPLLPAAALMGLWAAFAVLSGYWIFSLSLRKGELAPAPLRGIGLLSIVYGILLLIGASSGRTDPLQPLEGLGTSFAASEGGAKAAQSADATTVTRGMKFRLVRSVADLDRSLAGAQAAGKAVMLDFYADWCTSCKEMEKYSFTTAAVQTALKDVVLLQADVTANSADDQALLHRFGIFGPPTIAFFGADGVERKNYRVVGFMAAEKFSTHVAAAVHADQVAQAD